MGQTRQNSFHLNWAATGNIPVNQSQAINLSGAVTGSMASTGVIYSNVQTIPQQHNVGLELSWTGTPTGTFEVLCSESGNNFYALTFNPALGQPAGASGGYLIDLNQVPFKYYMLKYTNVTGTGVATAWVGQKDLG